MKQSSVSKKNLATLQIVSHTKKTIFWARQLIQNLMENSLTPNDLNDGFFLFFGGGGALKALFQKNVHQIRGSGKLRLNMR